MNENVFIKTFTVVWPYILVMSALAFIVFNFTEFDQSTIAVSFFLGSVVSVMLMSHNYKTTMRQAHSDASQLQRITIRNYVFRFFFYALILVIAYFSEGLMVIPVFVGFTSFKVALLITALIFKGGDSNDA